MVWLRAILYEKLLCNLQLSTGEKGKIKPKGAKPTTESQFRLYYNLFYCLDICPETSDEEKVSSKMRIEIGSSKVLTTDYKTKHIPIWNIQATQDLSLPKNLSFAPDLQITLIQKGWFGRENDVAEINIPLVSINEDLSEPKFYI